MLQYGTCVCRKVQNRTDENPMKPASKLRANQQEHGLAGWRQSGRPATQSRVSCHAMPCRAVLCCAVLYCAVRSAAMPSRWLCRIMRPVAIGSRNRSIHSRVRQRSVHYVRYAKSKTRTLRKTLLALHCNARSLDQYFVQYVACSIL